MSTSRDSVCTPFTPSRDPHSHMLRARLLNAVAVQCCSRQLSTTRIVRHTGSSEGKEPSELTKNPLESSELHRKAETRGTEATYDPELRKARRKAMASLRNRVKSKTLVDIEKESALNYNRRYSRPSKEFAGKLRRDVLLEGKVDAGMLQTVPASKVIKYLGEPRTTVTLARIFKTLNVGDAVELSTALNRSVLAVIAEVPSSHDDPRYTVMDRLGQLLYVEKSSFKLRIPRVIPHPWLKRAVHKIKENDAEYGSIKTTNDGFEMYTVNPFARSMISRPLSILTNAAWDQLPTTSRKLEVLHRLLQTVGPRQVSLITLVKAVNELNVQEFEALTKEKHAVTFAYEELGKKLSKSVGAEFATGQSLSLGREYGSVNLDEKFDIATLYAVVLALRNQPRLWSTTHSSRSTFLPMSITVLPMNYTVKITDTIKALKERPQWMTKFGALVREEKFNELRPAFDELLYLLKEYAVGNISDPVAETIACQLMKLTSDEAVTKTMIWELLVKVGFVTNELTNPTHFSLSLAVPGKSTSNKADIEQDYYDMVDVTTDRKLDLAKTRTDYTDMKVYCIDAETAHEIDDGVSIEDIDKKFARLHIHIADPVSYMSPRSSLTKIAFERAFTTYQPEMISAMLPKSMSDLAGLGVDGTKTRAITFSAVVNKKTGDVDFDSCEVKATYLSRFPKYTYNDVNRVLKQYESSHPTGNEEHIELWKMKNVSEVLRDARVRGGAVIFPDQGLSVQIRVTAKDDIREVDSTLDDGTQMTIDNQAVTPSVVLVTEFMILANRIAANFLKRSGRPGVFKAMPQLSLSGTARSLVPRLNALSQQNASDLTISDIVKAFKFITPAVYTSNPASHLMLGVSEYAPSTSPLRRFGDIVNHYQLHAYLNGDSEVFTKEQVQAMVLHIEARNDILKKASRSAGAFYAMRHLSEQLKRGEELENTKFIVMSKPSNGFVSGSWIGYGIPGQMKLATGVRPPLIGEIITRFAVVDVDYVGGLIELEQE